MGICQCSRIEVKEVLKSCLQLSGTQAPPMNDFEFIVDFVMDNYGNFRLKELKTAFEMMAADRLAIEKHIIFNPRLVGEVMSAYKKIAVQVRQKVEPKVETTVSKYIIDEEQAIKDEIEWWKKSKRKDFQLINHTIFDYLWKRKLIKLTKEEAEEIKSKVRIAILGQATKPKEVLISDDAMKTLAKKYSLMLYFNSLNK